MKSYASGCLAVVVVALLLTACQQVPSRDSGFVQLDQLLAAGQLDSAEAQLAQLQQLAADDGRLPQYQRQLAEAYLRQGQQALQSGDLDRATQALSRARSLMPAAPALTGGLDATLAQAGIAQNRRTPARLIDPGAAHSVIVLPPLQDSERLAPMLAAAAADIVNFHCAVRIDVTQAEDGDRLAALLEAQIKRLDPTFDASIGQSVEPGRAPQLVLTPSAG
jgi:tetratricopeptide (TPR) repeat protein